MREAPFGWGGLWLGLLLSAVLHAAIAAVLLREGMAPRPRPPERVVPLALAMFGDSAEAESLAAPGDPSPAAGQSRNPEPARTEETSIVATALDGTAEPPASAPAESAPPLIAPSPPALPSPPTTAVQRPSRAKPPPAPAKPAPAGKPPASTRTAKTGEQPVERDRKPRIQPKAKQRPPRTSERARTTARGGAATGDSPVQSKASGASPAPQRRDAGSAREPSGQGGSAAARAGAERAYLNALQAAIARYQQYPSNARRRGQTGVATLAFVIRADGAIGQIRLATSSGHASLDEAALQALRRLGRFQPIPKSIGRQSWPLRVPIRFALK